MSLRSDVLRRFQLVTIVILFVIMTTALSGCQHIQKTQHVSVFSIATMKEDASGHFVKAGYKKVNSMTTIEESNHFIKTDIKVIEDDYDLNGNYIRTKILHSTFNKSKITLEQHKKNSSKILDTPSTILIPQTALQGFRLDNLSDKEKQKVMKHILMYMKKMP